MLRFDVRGCTDITGFGLLGHAREMAIASGVTIEIETSRVPFLPGALHYAGLGALPAGLKNNAEFVSCAVAAEVVLPPEIEHLLYDPQTAGGLLIPVAEADAAALERAIPGAHRIGRVIARGEKPLRLL
jgi:selenide, water dikinase